MDTKTARQRQVRAISEEWKKLDAKLRRGHIALVIFAIGLASPFALALAQMIPWAK